MTERERLPNRRASEIFEFTTNHKNYTAMASRFDDGRLAEIFINNSKSSSELDVAARDAAIVCSIALQHGTPAEVIRQALCRDQTGKAQGPLAQALDILLGEGSS